MTKINGVFSLPFAEQIAFFKQKVVLSTQASNELSSAQHDQAFVVASAAKADLLNDLYVAVQAAIEQGESLSQFRKRFSDIVVKNGWTGWHGEKTKAGRAWRTRIIYTTNLRTSHAAGRFQQMTTPEMLRDRPYWTYRHFTRENPRLLHKSWDGITRPANDDWFISRYPPCGFGCNCRVETKSQSEFERMGGQVSTPPNDGTYFADTPNGQVELPNGVQYGFERPAGEAWTPNLSKYHPAIAELLQQELKS